MTEPIKMIEIFSGIGAQERSTRKMPMPFDVVATMDVDKDAILSYAAMRYDLEKEMEIYEFPSKEQMVSELQAKNVGYDFEKSKHTITMKTKEEKVKQYYIADKLSKNLGDVSLQGSLPYVDIICHTSPCQDYSQAGKGAGGDEGSGTRSSLMFESLRLIETSKPKYVLWENVAAVLTPKHRHNFIKYLEKMSELGYENAFDLLNGKAYGIPQNRLRIFCVSRKIEPNDSVIRNIDDMPKSSNKQVESTMKEVRSNPNIRIWVDYKMPETIPLTTRLKDILEKNVPEKYYLPDERIEKILSSSFMQEKKRIQMTDVCDTLLARDWKDPKCVPVEDEIKIVGNYMPSGHDASRVVDIDGIAPTVKENHGTVTAIVEPQIIKAGQLEGSFDQSGRVYDPEGIAPTIMSNSHGKTSGGYTSPKVIVEEAEPFIVASRGRNPDNPSDRTAGSPTEQRLEPNFSGCTNTLTSVQKDNYVVEPQVEKSLWTEVQKKMITEDGNIKRYIGSDVVDEFNVGDCADISFPNGYNKANRVFDGYSPAINGTTTQSSFIVKEPIIYDDYNGRISADQDAINTLTCNCGASAERNGVKILEPIVCEERKDEGIRLFKDDCVGTLRTIDACGDKRVIEPELMIEDVIFPVMVRKYPVDCNLLCECLRNHKNSSNLSNKDISDTLNVPLTKVEHWFRQDECFAIPDADIWFKLKELLGITANEFDESIMTFEIKDGVYDKANRCYHIEGIAPTLTAASANEKIIESNCLVNDIKWRIRKLMPVECWKLMAFSKSDHNRASKFVSNSALYKQAGNSIITNCLTALMCSLFIEDGYKAEVWTKYVTNIDD